MNNCKIWAKGLAAAAISGGANGVISGLAMMHVDPEHFNMQQGLRNIFAVAGSVAIMSAVIGVAAYLKQSPVPNGK